MDIEKSIIENNKKIAELRDVVIQQYQDSNQKNEQLQDMILQQSIAINNLLIAYNQNVININNVLQITDNLLKKLADIEIKNDNNDVSISEMVESLSWIKDELNQISSSIQEINIYGGSKW